YITNNTIMNSIRPITYEGDNSGAPNNLKIDRNLIWAKGHGVNAAIQSWGDRMNGVTILHNVLIADDKGVGVELRATDMGVNISNNIIDGLHDSNIAVGQLAVTGNLFTKPARQFLG